jgi:hypothetical protein
MALFQDVTKENETVVLDGNEFIGCKFQNCKMVYRGGEVPRLQHCHFTQCTWHLDDAAQRTVMFLRGIYHSGPGGRELVEDTLRHIRVR